MQTDRNCGETKFSLQMLRVDLIDPNDCNPNEMAKDQFDAVVGEIRRLGKPNKPIIVRVAGDRYEVIDGEHSLRAAIEAGLTEVPCEIVELNDYEAKRQMFRRNLHGRHNPVKEGELYFQMLEDQKADDGKSSNRRLAEELGLSEGSIRNGLAFRKAFLLRSRYAGKDTALNEIAALPIADIRAYLKLAESLRDKWLDSGSEYFDIDWFIKDKTLAEQFERLELSQFVQKGKRVFGDSLRRLHEFCEWYTGHEAVSDAGSYIRAAAERSLPFDCLELLPCRVDGQRLIPFVDLGEWRSALDEACRLADDDVDDAVSVLGAVVERQMRASGIDPANCCHPAIASAWQEVVDSGLYPFLLDADHLSIDERIDIAVHTVPGPEEFIIDVKQRVCERLRVQRENSTGADDQSRPLTISGLFRAVLKKQIDERAEEEARRLFRDFGEVRRAITESLTESEHIQGAVVNGLPAPELLAERLGNVADPEFALLAAALDPLGQMDPVRRWLDVISVDESVNDEVVRMRTGI